VLVRCRYQTNRKTLLKAGADSVVSEEVQASDALVRILEAHRRGDIQRDEIPEMFSDVLGGEDVGRALEERRARATEEEIRAAVQEVLQERAAGEQQEISSLVGMVKRRLPRRAGGGDILRVLEAEGVRRGSG